MTSLAGPCAPHSLAHLHHLLDLLNTKPGEACPFLHTHAADIAGEINFAAAAIHNLTKQLDYLVRRSAAQGNPHHPGVLDDAKNAVIQGRACA
jgi:hypothetical protein